MASTLIKKVMLKIAADDGDTEQRIDRISEKADELGRKHPDLKVRIDTAAAQAKLAALRSELKKTDDESTGAKTRFGALGSAVNALTLGVAGGWGEMSMFQKVMAGMSLATGLGEPLIAGLTVAVGGLSAGLVAAGMGLGVFGLVAKSNLTAASTAATAVQTAQIAYNSAVASGTKQSVAYAAEQKAILTAYAQLSPAQIAMSKQISNVQNAWQSFVQANTAGVDAVMTRGIGLLPKVLATMQPFMAPTEHALSGIVSLLGKDLGSSGFKSFMGSMASASGPMLTDLGIAVINIVKGIGGILKAFLPMAGEMTGGLDKITAKFAAWGQTLTGHSGFQALMSMFKSQTPAAMNVLKQLAEIIKTVVAQMTSMSTVGNSKALLQLALPVLQFVNALLKAHPGLVNLILYMKLASDAGGKLKIAFAGLSGAFSGIRGGVSAVSDLRKGFSDADAAASDATGVWGTFGGKLSSMVGAVREWNVGAKLAAAATKVWTGIQAAFDVVMDANPIMLIVIGIAALVAAIVICTIKFKSFRDFWKAAWRDIEGAAVAAWHFIDNDMIHPLMSGIATLVSWVESHWKMLATIIATVLLGPVGFVVAFIATHWQQVVSLTSRLVDDVTGFFRSLPGKIVGALAGLGSMLWNAGSHAIQSLISGIESEVGAVGSVMSGIAGKIAGFIGLSPAKEGPLSGGGAPQIRGRHIAADIAAGIMSGVPQAEAAAAAMARKVSQAMPAGGGSGVAAAGGGVFELQVTGAGAADWMALVKAIWPDLRLEVRGKGGGGPFSAQKALGQTWPAGA